MCALLFWMNPISSAKVGKGKDVEKRSNTSGILLIQGNKNNGDAMLKPSSSIGLTMFEKEDRPYVLDYLFFTCYPEWGKCFKLSFKLERHGT